MFLALQRSFGMQQTVRLLGGLGERYGSEHKYHDLRSPADAIKLLCINKPEFAKELATAHESGVGYTLVQAGEFLGYDDLQLPLGSNDLVLTPVVAGSGGASVTQILIGVGIIGASFFFPGAGLFGTVGLFGAGQAAVGVSTLAVLNAAAVGTALSVIGTSLVLGGISQLLAPQPVIPTLNNRTAPGSNTNAIGPQGVSRATSGQQSYAFAGPANTVGVGATVPLVYGKLLIGSHLLSAKVEVTDESDPVGEFFTIPGDDTITVNGEKPGNKFASHYGLRTRKWSPDQVKEFADVIKGNEHRRRVSNDILRFENAGEQKKTSDLNDFRDQDKGLFGNLMIFFEIDKGLSREIGGKVVPAFATYEITAKKKNIKGDSPIFTNIRATIQGLLEPGNSYKWCHAFTVGNSGAEKSDTSITVRYRILDTDADTKGSGIKIRAVGYSYFNESSENDTEDLVSEA